MSLSLKTFGSFRVECGMITEDGSEIEFRRFASDFKLSMHYDLWKNKNMNVTKTIIIIHTHSDWTCSAHLTDINDPRSFFLQRRCE